LKLKELRLNWEEIPALRSGWQLGEGGMEEGVANAFGRGGRKVSAKTLLSFYNVSISRIKHKPDSRVYVVDLFKFWC